MAQQPQASFVKIYITSINNKKALTSNNVYEKNITGMMTQNFIMGLSDDDEFIMGPYIPNIGFTLYCYDNNKIAQPLTISATTIAKSGKPKNYYGFISELTKPDELAYSFFATTEDDANAPKNLDAFCSKLISSNQSLLQTPGLYGQTANSIMNVPIGDYLNNIRQLHSNMQQTPFPKIFQALETYQRGE